MEKKCEECESLAIVIDNDKYLCANCYNKKYNVPKLENDSST